MRFFSIKDPREPKYCTACGCTLVLQKPELSPFSRIQFNPRTGKGTQPYVVYARCPNRREGVKNFYIHTNYLVREYVVETEPDCDQLFV